MLFLFKSTVSLAASALVLCSLADARALQAEDAKRAPLPFKLGRRGNFTSVRMDPETHSIVYGTSLAVSKRDSEDNRISDLLHQYNGHDFCLSYCQGDYWHPSVATVYQTQTHYVTISKPKTTTLQPLTTTKTIAGSHSQASSVTSTLTVETSTTLVVTGLPSTVDVEATSVITDYETLTSEAATQTITDTVYQTSLAVITSSGPDITITIDYTTSATAVPTIQPRDIRIPSYLSGHSAPRIEAACKRLFSPPPRQTITRVVEKTLTSTIYPTVTLGGKTVTSTTVTLQSASTITKLSSTTTISTILSTQIPLTTETDTTLTTLIQTSIETDTPSATLSLTSTLLSSTTVTAAGATHTACQNVVYSIEGGGVTTAGELNNGAATTLTGCCTECYDTESCTGWIYYGGYGCFLGSVTSGQGTSSTCPNGLGGFEVFPGNLGDDYAGGPGPCTGTFQQIPV